MICDASFAAEKSRADRLQRELDAKTGEFDDLHTRYNDLLQSMSGGGGSGGGGASAGGGGDSGSDLLSELDGVGEGGAVVDKAGTLFGRGIF